jgi:hypothetical protein
MSTVNTTTTFRYRQAESDSELPFGIRVASALGISVVADALDYVGALIFALPVVGDITDAIIVRFFAILSFYIALDCLDGV